ncbi:protein containing C-terminal region/beta chain of methionyl-tRNA synthetase [Desulfitobacterium dichloroeliminans LMG P-21439]|uniref:Methionine--tRNA ligase n=1 Tax=Desulfitobacterium dichloroeliminans (strain LMG P-21439 / DCA1) TaxID=871963 RepID=L0F3V5_DESDL|nr:methionine--tRNA ligase [Desulfitobacterium dichloroeliminans]AGA67608.1 protein containing C-terminal region/beta chain of methionyl-tRNA synthetase [Desulfitobacterium dichloroeliminans LMG P-21439]
MKYYITTPIFYPNASPHIGTAYTTVAADTFARYHRLKGDDVYFLTGTDENAQKIVRSAESKGLEPRVYVDGIVERFKALWDELDISYDDFIRTTEERHHRVVQKIFTKLYEQGDIYKSEYEGWYCTPCETFWTENKLVDGKCPNPDCGREVELLKEESYFFRLSKYQDALLQYIKNNPDFIQPSSRRNEMIKFIEGGLEDLCVSRTTFQWGIQVPFNPKHVVYVWLDALINYISALDYPDGDLYKRYWPAEVHLMGKDIVRFHAVIWPIILMALDIPLPKLVYGHGWYLSKEGGKISKSRGNVQDSFELIRRYGSDAIRYFLLRDMQAGADGAYSEDNLVERLNSDLANDLGNFVSRSLAMIVKYRGGVIPKGGSSTNLEEELVALSQEVIVKLEERLEAHDPAGALENLWRLVARLNKYVDETAPWTLAKQEDQQARLDTVLHTFAEAIRILGILCSPFMPKLTPKMFQQLGISEDLLLWEEAQCWDALGEGIQVARGEALFPRIDVSQFTVEEEKIAVNEVNVNKNAEESVKMVPSEGVVPEKEDFEPIKEEVSIDDFAKLDFRVAKVLHAEKVEKTDKLLKLEIEVAGKPRTIVSGIAQHYAPEDLVGKHVVIVANLKPAKLRGILSEGMILAASHEGILEVLTLDKDIPGGARVK